MNFAFFPDGLAPPVGEGFTSILGLLLKWSRIGSFLHFLPRGIAPPPPLSRIGGVSAFFPPFAERVRYSFFSLTPSMRLFSRRSYRFRVPPFLLFFALRLTSFSCMCAVREFVASSSS